MVSYNKQELLTQIQSLGDGDKPPTSQEFENCPETASAKTVKNRFETWNRAVQLAGYTPSENRLRDNELMKKLKRAVSTGEIAKIRDDTVDSCDYPCRYTYQRRFGGVEVAAVRGSITLDWSGRKRAIPLTKVELHQLIDQIPQIDPADQAVLMVALLTGCDRGEHKWVSEKEIEDTKTDSVIVFPSKSNRGSRSVSVGPLYNQFVMNYDPITSERLKQSIEFSNYHQSEVDAYYSLLRTSKVIDFTVDRPVFGSRASRSGPRVLHRDLRCTHYLFERVRGASRAMLKRRLALSDGEIEHYNRYLDEDENGWSVKIEWKN